MKLKQLEIVGFKSFVDKTTVHFPDGISAVVGPNGCGKSNIVDAMRWVMGEQSVKMLRGKAMEDVIFSGCDQRGPTNMAEVALTIDNDNGTVPEEYRNFSEIMVSRRLFRSGESGYYINKQPCRLRDVQNLLAGTGLGSRAYAIIEQGKISTLIDAGPEERRFFIEEAAGITRYKNRKHEALLKIKRTEHNLLRISDVIAEVKRQMNSLKRQARKAEGYKRLQGQIKNWETMLAAHQFRSIKAEADQADRLLEALKDSDFKHESELAKLDAAIAQIKEERTARYHRIAEEKARKYDTQRSLDKLEGNIAFGTKDLERLDGEVRQFREEAKDIEAKALDIEVECRQLAQRESELQEQIRQARRTLEEENRTRDGLKAQMDELNRALEAQKTTLVNLASRKATFQNTLENATQNKQNLSRRLSQLAEEKDESERELAGLKEQIAGTQNAHENLKKELDRKESLAKSLEEQLTANRQALSAQVRKVQETELERQKTRSQYAALKKMDENYEWSKKGVRVVMQEWKAGNLEEAGICGLVADVIEPKPSYEAAVEAALGDTLQYVVVKDQAGGMRAVETLRTLSAGKGGFVPLKTVRPIPNVQGSTSHHEGDRITQYMTIQHGFEAAIHALLGHVRIVGNLREALDLWNNNGPGQTIVTKQGDRLCLQGVLTAGAPENGTGGILTKKKEMKGLFEQISTLENALNMTKEEQKGLESRAVDLESQLQQAREGRRLVNQQLVELEKELYRLQEGLRHAQRHVEILYLETEQLEGERTDIESELSKHQEVINTLATAIQTEEQAIEKIRSSVEYISEKLTNANDRILELKLRSTTLEAESENTKNTLRRMSAFRDDGKDRLAHLQRVLKHTEEKKGATQRQIETDQAKLAKLYAELEAIEEGLGKSEKEYQAIEGTLQQNDQALAEVRSRQQETFQKIRQLELKQAERKMQQDNLVGRIHEKYHQQLETLVEELDIENLSVEEAEQSLARARERIARIGDVNLTAIEEYETLSERYGILTGQREDLMDAIDTLHHIIKKINRISLKRFIKTFKAVDQKVQEVFPKLFEGGTAKLALANPRRPLESGVSFLVRPPGKKLTRMSLLSGGEKALSAIALVFSIFLIKPAAFCVLDEIDAPLDDVNVYRFNQLLKEIGQQSQVVMITHDKQTMEVANALFGVTMEQKGVSKLISLDMTTSGQGHGV
jgi:chromosome segregation protein